MRSTFTTNTTESESVLNSKNSTGGSFGLFSGNSLFFFYLARISLFLSVFPFFSRDFRGSAGIKIPSFLVVFLAGFQKTRKGRRVVIVQKVFSEKVSAITQMRQKCVKNAPKKWVLVYWEERNVLKCVRNASKMLHQNVRNTFGGEHHLTIRREGGFGREKNPCFFWGGGGICAPVSNKTRTLRIS